MRLGRNSQPFSQPHQTHSLTLQLLRTLLSRKLRQTRVRLGSTEVPFIELEFAWQEGSRTAENAFIITFIVMRVGPLGSGVMGKRGGHLRARFWQLHAFSCINRLIKMTIIHYSICTHNSRENISKMLKLAMIFKILMHFWRLANITVN